METDYNIESKFAQQGRMASTPFNPAPIENVNVSEIKHRTTQRVPRQSVGNLRYQL